MFVITSYLLSLTGSDCTGAGARQQTDNDWCTDNIVEIVQKFQVSHTNLTSTADNTQSKLHINTGIYTKCSTHLRKMFENKLKWLWIHRKWPKGWEYNIDKDCNARSAHKGLLYSLLFLQRFWDKLKTPAVSATGGKLSTSVQFCKGWIQSTLCMWGKI